MSDCADCKTASEQMHHIFKAGCKGCCARAAARSPHYRRVRDAGFLDRDYKRLLAQFELTHDEVKQAANVDKLEARL